MHAFLRVVRDVWCAFRRPCRVPPPDDPTLARLRSETRAARENAERYRQRRVNLIEQAHMPRREGRE